MNDDLLMKRCIDLGKKALGKTYPNPNVGALLFYDGKIISEGFTLEHGKNHAEINVIKKINDLKVLKKSTLYVTLEPCSHYGKTPPCCEAIYNKNIKKVVIGINDPNELVNGKGIGFLRSKNIDVKTNVLESECKKLHKRFLTFQNKKRPYVILKWAETLNGFISPINKKNKRPFWISNNYSRQLVHKWRSQEHGILIGGQTYLNDSPILNSRLWDNNNPKKFVLTNSINLKDSKFFKINFKGNLSAKQICDELYKNNIQSVIVEGGTKTLTTFINDGIWDEARIIQSSKTIVDGIKSPKIKGKINSEFELSNDRIKFIDSN
tara:strand:+ start:273 stop:1238 length:966 start_codon:yes stop_codon:yes gene_type:complete